MLLSLENAWIKEFLPEPDAPVRISIGVFEAKKSLNSLTLFSLTD
jgi:hypothetical protein